MADNVFDQSFDELMSTMGVESKSVTENTNPNAEEPKAADSAAREDAKAEEAKRKTDEYKVDANPFANETTVDAEASSDDPFASLTGDKEEPKEAPKEDTPKAEEPAKEEAPKEEPKKEAPKAEEPAKEEAPKEEPKPKAKKTTRSRKTKKSTKKASGDMEELTVNIELDAKLANLIDEDTLEDIRKKHEEAMRKDIEDAARKAFEDALGSFK